MANYKNLKKPNHWRIVLYLENKKTLLDLCEKGHIPIPDTYNIKDRFTVAELSKELRMAQSHIRKHLKELSELGYVHICKYKGQIEVVL